MRDRRATPFWYVTTGASRTLRAAFPFPSEKGRPERKTALAIYAAMCDVANEHRSSRFRESRETIRAYAGVSVRTLDTYVALLVKAGLIAVERRQEGGVHLPSEWVLVDVDEPPSETTPDCGGGATVALGVAQSVQVGSATAAPPRRACRE